MKKKPAKPDDELLPEHDFSRGRPNQYASRLKAEGYTVRVYEADGTYTEHHVLKEAAVILEPEVQE